MVSPSDGPNLVCNHSNALLSYEECKIKAYNPDHTNNIIMFTLEKIILVNPEDKFVYHAQYIITSRD